MTPRQDSASSTELQEGTNAGGAAPPQRGAPSEEPAAGAEAAAAGTVAAPVPGEPRMELDPPTEAALAGHLSAHGEAASLDPAICLICNKHTFGDALVVTASCGHPFHTKCIKDALKREKTKCPCGAAYPPRQKPFMEDPMHKRRMDNHTVQCPQGCGEVIPFVQLREHVHSDGGCSITPYRCGNSGCGVLFPRKDKDEHLGSCPHRLVPCEQCGQLIKDRDLLQHKAEQCPRRKIRCPHCQEEHLFCDTEEHMRRCSGGASMRNITELKEMMVQQQQAFQTAMAQQQQSFQATLAQQQHTIERQQREIAEQSFRLIAFENKVLSLPEREAVARAAVELGRAHSLAELRRLDEQQMQRVPGLDEARWAQERAALPQHLYVSGTHLRCGVREAVDGRYSLRPERVNRAAVWGQRDCRLYRSREGHWGLALTAGDPQRNRGWFRLTSQPSSPTPLSIGGWESNNGLNDMSSEDGWWRFRDLSVTAP